jgi:hypothetical protein
MNELNSKYSGKLCVAAPWGVVAHRAKTSRTAPTGSGAHSLTLSCACRQSFIIVKSILTASWNWSIVCLSAIRWNKGEEDDKQDPTASTSNLFVKTNKTNPVYLFTFCFPSC